MCTVDDFLQSDCVDVRKVGFDVCFENITV